MEDSESDMLLILRSLAFLSFIPQLGKQAATAEFEAHSNLCLLSSYVQEARGG